ncbi:hypothetical protein EX30DRAFT_343784 [Ascodesmis nigricans]|uniref:Uncharacterized protein n=1 Tax=Ascodesmis nigricans TaxID=341454 RepID=A0A4S2MRI4_9PEZI|nr:hypothetical protein EX30DRAFT_343784 [Ascodesmis nigricans]
MSLNSASESVRLVVQWMLPVLLWIISPSYEFLHYDASLFRPMRQAKHGIRSDNHYSVALEL